MKTNNTVVMVILGIIIAAASFYGGMKYQSGKAQERFAGRNGQFMQGGPNGGTGRFGQRQGNGNGSPVVGEIIGVDDKSMTVKLMDGSSKIVILAASTTFSKTDTAAKTDLKSGMQIAAFGPANSDGSITAQNIQLNPMFRFGQRLSGTPPPNR